MRIRMAMTVLLVLALTGCSSEPNYLGDCEARLGLGGPPYPKMHMIAHYPGGLGFNFPGYLVGFEKAPRDVVTRGGDVESLVRIPSGTPPDLADNVRDIVGRLKSQPKIILPTHVVRFSRSADPRLGFVPSTLYSAYPSDAADRCLPADGRALVEGMTGIGQPLRDALIGDLERARAEGRPFTHLLVMSQGWNTTQEESIRNFNSLVSSLIGAAAADGVGEAGFRPLVVAMSWPSLWDMGIELFSYFNKANDADEVGLLGVNHLLNRTAAAAKASQPGLKVVAVGHSFGARVITRAAFSGRFLNGDVPPARPVVDLLVGLQGAVSINRFRPGHSLEGAPYRDLTTVGAVVMTASANDTVNGMAFWSDHAGDIGSFAKTCGTGAAPAGFSCLSADETGAWSGARAGLVNYVDATRLIAINASGTSGKAHSDIYRPPHGVFMWTAIKALAR